MKFKFYIKFFTRPETFLARTFHTFQDILQVSEGVAEI